MSDLASDPKQIGARLKAARLAKELTQDDLAREIGVRQLAVSEAELGKVTPRVQTLIAAARALGVDLDWLATGEGRGPAESQPAA